MLMSFFVIQCLLQHLHRMDGRPAALGAGGERCKFKPNLPHPKAEFDGAV